MRQTRSRLRHRLLVWLVSLLPQSPVLAAEPDFSQVSALFSRHCLVCHQGEGAPLGLRLDSHAGVMQGSQRGAVVVAGDPDSSELIRRLTGDSQPRMPLTGPPFLEPSEIELVREWIRGGARPGGVNGPAPVAKARPLPAPGEPVYYEDIQPILLQRCIKCHRDGGQLGAPPEGLRLSTLPQLLAGGDRVVVVPGVALASELVRRIVGLSRPRMPFDGPPYLSEDEIRVITDWVSLGARDETGQPAEIPVGKPLRLEGILSGRWELDGLPLQVGPGTRIKKRVGVGSYVRIRGRVGEDGRILVERIQAK